MDRRKKIYLIFIVSTFGLIYALISLVNHYFFRTYALDLGAYTNALYDYIHLQWNDCSVFLENPKNLLSDHFDIYLILFSPFSLIFKSYTLLVIQMVFILSGGIGVFKYFSLTGKNPGVAFAATLFFFLFFGVFSAVSFDYHSNVVAASMLPWFFVFLSQKRNLAMSIVLLFILISKENTSLWIAFVCLGLSFEYRKDKQRRNYLLLAAMVSIAFFLLITTIVMPGLNNQGAYPHFNYGLLGKSYKEALTFLFHNPLESVKAVFINHTNHPYGDYVKMEFHILLFLSGLPLLIFKPQYFLMLVPLYFQKMFNDNITLWGIDGHYNIEFAPVLAIGIFSVVDGFRKRKTVILSSGLVLIFSLVCTLRVMDNTIVFTNKSRIRIYQSSHYKRHYDVAAVYKQMKKIPPVAVVSAESPFLPHLALRDKIYQFPMIRDAEYVIYSKSEETYPIDRKVFDSLIITLERSEDWHIEYNDTNITLLKRAEVGKK